jgi:hypothetical protein
MEADYTIKVAGNTWKQGMVGGDFNGCGWIEFGVNTGGTGSSSCPIGGMKSYGEFIAPYGGAWAIWKNKANEDGVNVANSAGCPEYANYRPWATSTPIDGVRTIGEGSTLRVRYRAKTGYMGVNYLMVHDTGSGAPVTWVFVPESCFPSLPPPGTY